MVCEHNLLIPHPIISYIGHFFLMVSIILYYFYKSIKPEKIIHYASLAFVGVSLFMYGSALMFFRIVRTNCSTFPILRPIVYITLLSSVIFLLFSYKRPVNEKIVYIILIILSLIFIVLVGIPTCYADRCGHTLFSFFRR